MSMYTKYAEKPIDFLALTGYTREEFDNLLPDFRDTYYEWMSTHRLDGKPRGNRKYSDYENSPLPSIEEKLFFILNYLKTNNLQSVQGALFGMSQPKANVWIHCLHTVLIRTLDKLSKLPARQMGEATFDEGEEALYFHDGTERPIERPANAEKQKTFYSGKKNSIP